MDRNFPPQAATRCISPSQYPPMPSYLISIIPHPVFLITVNRLKKISSKTESNRVPFPFTVSLFWERQIPAPPEKVPEKQEKDCQTDGKTVK